MKYVSFEDVKNAQLTQISDNATEYDRGRVTGWNECIQAIALLARESVDVCGEVIADAIKIMSHEISDTINTNIATITGTASDLDTGFLEALGKGHIQEDQEAFNELIRKDLEAAADSPDIYDEEYPDCEECRFSGLLTDD